MNALVRMVTSCYCRHGRHEWRTVKVVYRSLYEYGMAISADLRHCNWCGAEEWRITPAGRQQLGLGATWEQVTGLDPKDRAMTVVVQEARRA